MNGVDDEWPAKNGESAATAAPESTVMLPSGRSGMEAFSCKRLAATTVVPAKVLRRRASRYRLPLARSVPFR